MKNCTPYTQFASRISNAHIGLGAVFKRLLCSAKNTNYRIKLVIPKAEFQSRHCIIILTLAERKVGDDNATKVLVTIVPVPLF
jgi:hypothetical protein